MFKKSISNYNCELCDYNTSILQNYNKHLLTLKHKINTNRDTLEINGNGKVSIKYQCNYCNYSIFIKNKIIEKSGKTSRGFMCSKSFNKKILKIPTA